MESLGGEEENMSSPMIIAIKGGSTSSNKKREIGTKLAEFLKILLIDEGDIIPALSKSIFSKYYKDLCFKIVCQIASTQLSLNLKVIINTDLSDQNQIEHLMELATSMEASLFIIECDDENGSYNVGDVPKLHVNTTLPFIAEEFVSSMLESAAKFGQEINIKCHEN